MRNVLFWQNVYSIAYKSIMVDSFIFFKNAIYIELLYWITPICIFLGTIAGDLYFDLLSECDKQMIDKAVAIRFHPKKGALTIIVANDVIAMRFRLDWSMRMVIFL